MEHIEFEQLVDNFEGRSSGPLPQEIVSHLNECVQCSTEFRRLADFFAYIATDVSEEVPQATTARILNIYHRRPVPDAAPVKKASGLGFLVFDDWAMALNERYSGLDSRQMLFRVGDYDLDIRIEFMAGKCRLSGQILPGVGEATITLSSPINAFTTAISEFGEFEFEPVEPGAYSIVISGGGEELRIEEVPLKR